MKTHKLAYHSFAYALITFAAINSPGILAAQLWTAPLTLSPANDLNANDGQQVAVNNKGQIVTAWNGLGGPQARIKTAKALSNPVLLDPQPATPSKLVDLAEAVDNSAVALVKTSTGLIKSTFYNPTTKLWSTATTIPVSTGATVSAVKVRFDGKIVPSASLLWVESTAAAGVCQLMSSQGSYLAGWGTPQVISSNNCFTYIDLAVNPRGEAVVALGNFHAIRHGGIDAYVTSRNVAGAWTPLQLLAYGVYQTQTKVAIANNGVAIASFSDANLGVQWSKRSPVDGSWSVPAVIDGFVPAVDTAIAMSSTGNAAIVYTSYYANVPPASLQVVTKKAGSNVWGAPVSLTDPMNSDITSFNIVATPAGSYAVSWVDEGTLPATAPLTASASLGVSTLAAGATVWSESILDWYYNFNAVSANTLSIAAAAGKTAAFWSAYDSSNTYQSVKLATTALK